jgi:hypothetical protein
MCYLRRWKYISSKENNYIQYLITNIKQKYNLHFFYNLHFNVKVVIIMFCAKISFLYHFVHTLKGRYLIHGNFNTKLQYNGRNNDPQNDMHMSIFNQKSIN